MVTVEVWALNLSTTRADQYRKCIQFKGQPVESYLATSSDQLLSCPLYDGAALFSDLFHQNEN